MDARALSEMRLADHGARAGRRAGVDGPPAPGAPRCSDLGRDLLPVHDRRARRWADRGDARGGRREAGRGAVRRHRLDDDAHPGRAGAASPLPGVGVLRRRRQGPRAGQYQRDRHDAPLQPRLAVGVLEYAQTRGFVVDPARVRRPTDQARVERSVPYVRGRRGGRASTSTPSSGPRSCPRRLRRTTSHRSARRRSPAVTTPRAPRRSPPCRRA